ncbi:MAG: YkvA family protein [Anaerolineae bacterium]|nr:YkvA family protein [Anaerolineae bacterium]MDW8098267.1 YkvA family protein [Anaerolineae bacterium]
MVWRTLRLAWRLLRDHRVSPLVKLLAPGLVLFYLLLPVDVAPDLFPLLGQLDDLAMLLIAARLLVGLSPSEVVAEHEADLFGSDYARSSPPPPGEVVETTYRVMDE